VTNFISRQFSTRVINKNNAKKAIRKITVAAGAKSIAPSRKQSHQTQSPIPKALKLQWANDYKHNYKMSSNEVYFYRKVGKLNNSEIQDLKELASHLDKVWMCRKLPRRVRISYLRHTQIWVCRSFMTGENGN